MKKTLIPFAALSIFAAVATSCGNNTKTWTYADALADGELGYVTLYGEEGNPEADDRKAGVNAALKEIAKELYNPKTGEKGVTVKEYREILCVDGPNKWSDTAAKNLLRPVLTQYDGKIDFISSNNDGMAIAVSKLTNLLPNTPIVGFDALSDACDLIKKGSLAGSVTQNGDDQALLTLTLLANELKTGVTDLTTGYPKDNLNKEFATGHIYQTNISAVTKENADKYKPGSYVTVGAHEGAKNKKLLVALYSSVDNFINETYKLALDHYGKAMGFTVDIVSGDGSNNLNLLNLIKPKIDAGNYDAYAFNIIEHTSYKKYLDLIGTKPVVFFNRQPKEGKNPISDFATIKDSAEKVHSNVYFVGTAAGGQGKAQGEVVKTFFKAESAKAEAAK